MSPRKPSIKARSQHSISRKNIDPDALNVLYRLSNAGHIAYLVGGSVRDLLLGIPPKDFDVATSAYPNQIKRLFRNAFLIGRRFRLALIRFGPDKHIEASTFRREPDRDEVEDESHLGALYQRDDNSFGTPAEDALRRDFTINALFYDIRDFAVIDYVGGLKDLDRKVLRSIGDPNIRFREDPVRMLRAMRFSARLDFRIHRDSDRAIQRHYEEIAQASKPRLFDEMLKLFGQGAATAAFRLLWSSKIMSILLPHLSEFIQDNGRKRCVLWKQLEVFDSFADDPLAADSALRIALILYPVYEKLIKDATGDSEPPYQEIAEKVINESLYDFFSTPSWRPPRMIREDAASIMAAQTYFDRDNFPMRQIRTLSQKWFPAALLLYRIRLIADDGDLSDAERWSEALDKHLLKYPEGNTRRRRRPRRGYAREKPEGAEAENSDSRRKSRPGRGGGQPERGGSRARKTKAEAATKGTA